MQQAPKLLARAKHMRRMPADAEARFWRHLRAGRLAHVKFKRQQPIGAYIVDFVSFAHRLVIEVDGGQHAEHQQHDAQRTLWLQAQGFRVVRFWNDDVLLRTELVREEMVRVLGKD